MSGSIDRFIPKFKAYWRRFGVGILMIRWLGLPAMRREAERRYRARRQARGAVQDQAGDDSARASGNRSGGAKVEMHERFMDLALDEARRAAECGEVPVGAVVVADGEIVGRGFNQPIGSNDPTAHAEIVALRAAARAAGNYRLTGSTLYVTVEPCLMCVGAMVHARIGALVYGADEPKSGAIRSAVHALELPGLNHQFEVITGAREEACRELIQGFFRQKRSAPEEEAGPPSSARGSGPPRGPML